MAVAEDIGCSNMECIEAPKCERTVIYENGTAREVKSFGGTSSKVNTWSFARLGGIDKSFLLRWSPPLRFVINIILVANIISVVIGSQYLLLYC